MFETSSITGLPLRIWLASRSPRRKEILDSMGVQPRLLIVQNDAQAESLEAPKVNENPLAYVERVTRLKIGVAIDAMLEQQLTGWVLAADTTVNLNGQILGKPAHAQEAKVMLQGLSGHTHQVHTCVAVAKVDATTLSFPPEIRTLTNSSSVTMASIPAQFLEQYIASGMPFDKAGGYGIQSEMGLFVSSITGSYSGIMGLPMHETAMLLTQTHHNE